MIIREADLQDKKKWDTFVDSEGGSFHFYFDWKYFYETRGNDYIPLMIESDKNQLIGILPIVKEKHLLYASLNSDPEGSTAGILLKNDLLESDKQEAISELLKFVISTYSDMCYLSIKEGIATRNGTNTIINETLENYGFKYSYNQETGFPCNHLLPLECPFDESLWRGLWPQKLKNQIEKAAKSGVTIIQDTEFQYQPQFIEMLSENYKRHKNPRSIEKETLTRIRIFNDRSKLFIALRDGQPIVGLLCHYTPTTCFLAKLGSYSRDTGYASKLCLKTAIEDACNSGYKTADFGSSSVPSVAFFKDQFKFSRVPAGAFEIVLCQSRYWFHQVSIITEEMRHDKMFLWNNRQKILKRLFK